MHLTVDTTLANTTRMAIKAYVCVPLGVPNGKQGSMFTPVKVQVCQNLNKIYLPMTCVSWDENILIVFIYRLFFNIVTFFYID